MNSREIEQAVVDNQNLVRFAINRYFPGLREDEDIFQVGWIGLWKACLSYDSSKSKLSTFAVRCIINEVRMELRSRAKLWRFGDVASLDELLYFDKEEPSLSHTKSQIRVMAIALWIMIFHF